MSPEEKAQLRHLMRKSKQVPEPQETLLKHIRKQTKSRAGQLLKASELPSRAVRKFKKDIK